MEYEAMEKETKKIEIREWVKELVGNRIAWFATRENQSGFDVYRLNEAEKKEFGEDVYRITPFARHFSDPLFWTSVVKIQDGKVRFLDNEALLESDEIKWGRPLKMQVKIAKMNGEFDWIYQVEIDEYLKVLTI